MPDGLLKTRFDAAQALGETLQRFRATVVPTARRQFDAGAAAFARGEYAAAEAAFRESIQPVTVGGAGGSNMAAVAYLGAVAAAAGKDEEARVWHCRRGWNRTSKCSSGWDRPDPHGPHAAPRAAGEGAAGRPIRSSAARSPVSMRARQSESNETVAVPDATAAWKCSRRVEWSIAHEKEGRASEAELALLTR